MKIIPVLGTPLPAHVGVKVKRDHIVFPLVFQRGSQTCPPMERAQRELWIDIGVYRSSWKTNIWYTPHPQTKNRWWYRRFIFCLSLQRQLQSACSFGTLTSCKVSKIYYVYKLMEWESRPHRKGSSKLLSRATLFEKGNRYSDFIETEKLSWTTSFRLKGDFTLLHGSLEVVFEVL